MPCRLTVLHVHPDETPAPDVPGSRVTITLPTLPTTVKTWQELLNWLKEHPEIIIALISAILMLLEGLSPPPKR